jgi:hypothetical protein
MKLAIHAATASALIAAGIATAPAASAEAVHAVMVMQHDPAVSEKLRRTTAKCVERAQVGRFEDALPFCNLAIRYAEHDSAGASVDPSLEAAVARTNRAVVSWLLGREERAAADMAVARVQAPDASFVRKNLAVMGMEPPATTLEGGAED